MNKKCQTIIIGSGAAGIATAIQLKRFGLDVCVLEKAQFGGLVNNANLIENYLGFPKGVSGIEFVSLFREQFEQYDIPIFYEEVVDIKKENSHFIITTDKKIYNSQYTVIATGTKPKELPFHSDKIFYEVAQIQNCKDKDIAIIGAGDAAFDYAINLSKNNRVSIFNRSERIKSIPLLYNRAASINNIKYQSHKELMNIKESNNKVVIEFNDNTCFECDYVLAAIGREPNDRLFTNNDLKQNSNLFIIGDVKNGILRQTSIATGEGLKTATIIDEHIRKNKIENIS